MDGLPAAAAIRPAALSDLDALAAIEAACFPDDGDRISRRSFRHLLIKGHQVTRVACGLHGEPVGYAMVLFHRGTSLARLYSLAVMPDCRGHGIARALLGAAEGAALEEGAAYLRLEVRVDGAAAIALYEGAGYRPFGRMNGYYADGADALRMEKPLAAPRPAASARIPYRAQSLDFTCGPACLMMALAALGTDLALDRTEELRIWREATTVFMTRGTAGCSPYGLALAAHRRGLRVALHVRDPDIMFIDTVRDPRKKEVIRLVQEDYLAELSALEIPVHDTPLSLAETEAALARGAVPIVLISTYALDREKVPHWVVVTALDGRFAYVHDPFVDPDVIQSETDRMALPIPREDFERMSRFGRARQRAALLLEKGGRAALLLEKGGRAAPLLEAGEGAA
jgi:ribosomal protein S18 acetylase RimI-like enzyme